jgi:homogentisate 1,2-dioxygenase
MTEGRAHSAQLDLAKDTATKDQAAKPSANAPPMMRVWTRDGFTGMVSVDQSIAYPPDYLRVEGPHAPRRSVLSRMSPVDADDPAALPMLLMESNGGLRIRISGLRQPMPHVVRNVDAEELHFVQEGGAEFQTEFGTVSGERGDFICIPKSIAYRVVPRGAYRSMVLESRSPYKFVTPYPVGMINFERDLVFPTVMEAEGPGAETSLLLKAWDGEHTVFTLPKDPLAYRRHVAGKTPVWKLSMDKIQKLVALPAGGPPYPFLSNEADELLLFNLGDRPVDYRPPIHLNADYDEVLFYVDGAQWGGCTEPGTFTWVPKGVLHHGVSAFTNGPHRSFLLETRPTLRWSEQGKKESEPMETASYGPLVKA